MSVLEFVVVDRHLEGDISGSPADQIWNTVLIVHRPRSNLDRTMTIIAVLDRGTHGFGSLADATSGWLRPDADSDERRENSRVIAVPQTPREHHFGWLGSSVDTDMLDRHPQDEPTSISADWEVIKNNPWFWESNTVENL